MGFITTSENDFISELFSALSEWSLDESSDVISAVLYEFKDLIDNMKVSTINHDTIVYFPKYSLEDFEDLESKEDNLDLLNQDLDF